MKILFTLFILFFSSLGVADDISDFQIEGISIGNSALKFFNLNQIKNNEFDYYDDKTFIPVQIDRLSFFETYESVDFRYKQGDSDYIIHSLAGVINYDNNIEECYPKMDLIVTNSNKFNIE